VKSFLKTGVPDLDKRSIIIPLQALEILQGSKALQSIIVIKHNLTDLDTNILDKSLLTKILR
jgi:ABC-type lipoprotein release transport system permease subunit